MGTLKSLTIIVLIIVGFITITTPNTASQTANVLRMGLNGEQASLNPFIARGEASLSILCLIYEPLVTIGMDGRILPWLAEYEAIERDRLRFRLSDKALWHDGSEVTSDDVIFTLSTITSPKYASRLDVYGLSNLIKSVNVLDKRTFEIVTPKAYRALSVLSKVPIVQRRSFENVDPLSPNLPRLVGSGPFRLIRSESHIVELAPFESYRHPLSKNFILRLRSYPATGALIDGLIRGDIDLVAGYPFSPVDLQRLTDGRTVPVSIAGDRLLVIFFNVKGELTGNRALRMAIYQLMDTRRLLDVLDGPAELIGLDLLSSKFNWLVRERSVVIERNVTVATSLLRDAGYTRTPDGRWVDGHNKELMIRVGVQSDSAWAVKVGRYFSSTLKDLGIRVTEINLNASKLGEYYAQGGYDVVILEVGYGDDLREVYADLLTPTGRSNWSRYNDPLLPSLIYQLDSEIDPSYRARLISTIGNVLSRDLPLIPVVASIRLTAYRSGVVDEIGQWHPLSPFSILRVMAHNERLLLIERVTTTLTTKVLVTSYETHTRVVERYLEIAPEWVYVTVAAISGLMVLGILIMIALGIRHYRRTTGISRVIRPLSRKNTTRTVSPHHLNAHL
ncbi:MAG: ABC transporter substrate-binding protein [Aigarchaeota archaeon]|nr:ABC transporter substrate-binding protein [Aigarchaeota archaeon]MDW8092700.1 ABC transporter substrate-binding protein [Nitrososphaerota archaeon]